MSYYETVFIVRQDMSPSQVETMADHYAEILGQHEGSVVKREMWGLRTLAYRMNKNRKGHYVMMHLDTPAAGLTEIERQMRLSEDVLRYMSVRVDEIPEGPSPMLQQRERGPRDRDGGPRDGGPRDRDGGPRDRDGGPRDRDGGPREGRSRDDRDDRPDRGERGGRDERSERGGRPAGVEAEPAAEGVR